MKQWNLFPQEFLSVLLDFTLATTYQRLEAFLCSLSSSADYCQFCAKIEHENDLKLNIRSKAYSPSEDVMCSESALTLYLLPLNVTLQVLVWPQLLSPLCSPLTTTCSWAGHFTICLIHLEQPSPGHPATTPGILSKTVPVVSLAATTPNCSPPVNSSSSENISHHNNTFTLFKCKWN